ncbi:NADH:flavin oxidoreductase/NADH oxidase [Xanthomonas massiliensis]|jgi:2,4-dienoyl-CoA reductase-like NADH-dependent reductase (Old Yellow Enzyme family)|uniref:NADH:flavin oxidoreductase/NADH oxidase n=1 Tax=Xanthomonas massiliensis TaxID=1720302 RepID=UPI0008241325|nr:NADH:flavin oxidoreductase/NADH oxidase [Xanthomonas massiliensis]
MSHLFSPLSLGPLRLPNRIVIPPMCQYSANGGAVSDWHHIHLGNLALSGAGLLIIEATAVEPRGRITYADVGLWDDTTEAALAGLLASLRRWSPMAVGIQLAHAGRKASTDKPWLGRGAIAPDDALGWRTVSASALPFEAGAPSPQALDEAGIDAVIAHFVEAACRAERLGLQLIELHGAHGYLIHQFLSPLCNHRDDAWGGTLENRMRLALRVFEAVRAAVSDKVAVGMRISATDWVEGGWDLAQSIELAKALEARGADFIHVSSGGLDPRQQIALGPGYQVPFAEAIKAQVRMPVIAVGLITEPDQAEAILAEGRADAVALARGMLFDPRWPWHAAAALGDTVHAAPQYLRCEPHELRGLFG